MQLAACALTTFIFASDSLLAAPPLARRVFLGTQVQPVADATRQRLGLANTRGVEVLNVLPDSTAHAAGVRKGDILLALGDREITSLERFLELVGALRGGTSTTIKINREGTQRQLDCPLTEMPRETSGEFDIEYESVAASAGQLRTVLTIPHSAKQAQAVLLLSGLANVAAEHPAADPAGLKSIAYALTLQGFAVLRVDKPGCGDSEGGPAREVDFTAVVDGYVAAVKQLKQHPRIDPGQIYIVGLSLGGLQAPLVALQEPVRGIAVIGTFARSWSEYLQETTRRQLQLSGADAGQIDQHVAELKAGWQALGQEGLSPDDIMSKHPELTNWVEQNWVDGKYFSGAGYRFFQQLCQVDVAAAWQRFDGPVLALWGSTDFVSSRADHELVAAIANGKQAGRGQFQTLEGIEHSLRAAATIEDAIRIASQPGGQPAPAVTDAVASWLKRVAE